MFNLYLNISIIILIYFNEVNMNLWAFWDATKTKFKDIIKFVHISFLANLYYRFLNNIVGFIMLLSLFFVFYLSYSYLKKTVININNEKISRELIIKNQRQDFLKQLIVKMKSNSVLIEKAESEGINNLISLAIIGTIEKISKDNLFDVEDFNVEVLTQTKIYNRQINSDDEYHIFPKFDYIFGFGGYHKYLNQDEYFSLITFFKENNIKDSLGIIDELIPILEKDLNYRSFLKLKNTK